MRFCKSNLILECKNDIAYHSGKITAPRHPQIRDPEKCLEKCDEDSSCLFWDFDTSKKICRLRSESGPKGEEVSNGYTSGSKYCVFGM